MKLTTFAQRMKNAREEKGLKQNELAKIIGVTPTTISSYEKADSDGNGKKPTLENAQAIAKTLGVSLDWLCGMSESKGSSYVDFEAKDYFKSLVTILMETSSTFDDTLQNGIVISNKDVLRFLKKLSDLIQVYRNGSIPEDLFNVCVDKIINDYDYYTVYGNCILDSSEAVYAEDRVMNLIDEPDAGVGMYTINVEKHQGYSGERTVKLLLTQKMLEMYTKS